MRRKALLAGLLALLVAPLFPISRAETSTGHPWIDELNVVVANNKLNITGSVIYDFSETWNSYTGIGDEYLTYQVYVTKRQDLNGTWILVNENGTLVASKTGVDPDFKVSFDFTELRITEADIAIQGFIRVWPYFYRSSGHPVFEHYNKGAKIEARITEEETRYVVNIYGEPCDFGKVAACETLLEVFAIPKPEYLQVDFSLDFQNQTITLFGNATGLPSSWTAVEGCGYPWIDPVGGFSVTWYSYDPSTAADVLADVDAKIRSDSQNLSWIKGFSVQQALNFTQIALSRNKNVSELTPADFGTFQASDHITIIELPDEITITSEEGEPLAVAAPGIIFTKSREKNVILHELGHEAGFCDVPGDPLGPYNQWKAYWQSILQPSLSEFTNSTWHFEQDNWHLWAYLASSPVYLSGRAGPLVLRMKASEARTVSVSVEVAQGSVSDALKQVTVGTDWSDAVFIYDPPDVANLTVIAAKFTISEPQSGLNRVLIYYLTVMPACWASELNLTQEQIEQIWPTNWTWPTLPEDWITKPPFAQLPLELFSQLESMLSGYNWSGLNPYPAKAQENLQKAQEDIQMAQMAQDPCVRWLYSQAAQLRYQAAMLYAQAAQQYEQTLQSMGTWQGTATAGFAFALLPMSQAYDYGVLVQQAQMYEQKAAQLEMQAQLGCPAGFLGGQTGLSPLLGLGAMLGLFGGFGLTSRLPWLLIVLGGAMAAIGLVGAFTKQRNWAGALPAGIAIALIGLFLAGVI